MINTTNIGTHFDRINYRPKGSERPYVNEERVFFEQWDDANVQRPWLNSGRDILFCLMGREPTKEERTAAATVIQWLGTNIGRCWLHETLGKAGYVVKADKQAHDREAERQRVQPVRVGGVLWNYQRAEEVPAAGSEPVKDFQGMEK